MTALPTPTKVAEAASLLKSFPAVSIGGHIIFEHDSGYQYIFQICIIPKSISKYHEHRRVLISEGARTTPRGMGRVDGNIIRARDSARHGNLNSRVDKARR